MYTTVNPYNQEKISDYQYLEHTEAVNIIKESAKTYSNWKSKSLTERLKFIDKLAKTLDLKKDALAAMATAEMGKPITQAIAELNKCKLLCEFYLQKSELFLADEKITSDGSESYATYEPLGVILGIMPWNFPYWQVFRFAIPTIIAGNTVAVKHASNVAGCAALIEELFTQAGFPEGVYKNLFISGDQVKEIINLPEVKAISLTGSEKAGASAASTAAAQIKKAVLELGGSNGLIVLEDADMEHTVKEAVTARFQNTGQSCIAAKRFFVHEKIYNIFLEKFKAAVEELKIGDPTKEDTYIGPMARVDLAEEIEKQVNKSVEMGAKIVTGGTRNEAFYAPTILTGVTPEMPVFKQEVFGPAVPVIKFSSFEEAVALSNQSEFGLGVSVFTTDIKNIKSKLHLFEEGAVFINALVKSDPALPFGGVKRSGYGRELSEHGIKEFVNVKTVYIK